MLRSADPVAQRAELDRQIARNPRDGRALVLLARLDMDENRFADAARRYEQAVAAAPKVAADAAVWCEYADALGMTQGRSLAGKPTELIQRALALDAAHPRALEMAGSAAYEQRDYAAAVRWWSLLLAQLAPGTPPHDELSAALDRARQRAQFALPGEAPSPPPGPRASHCSHRRNQHDRHQRTCFAPARRHRHRRGDLRPHRRLPAAQGRPPRHRRRRRCAAGRRHRHASVATARCTRCGPNSSLDTTPLINAMLDDLGIRGERLDASEVASTRYVVRDGKATALPTSPGAFLTTSAFSLGAKLMLLREPFVARAPAELEESIAQFVRRRLGQEFLDYAIDPFVAGIYAGDPERISVPAAFPRLHALEQKYGSLIKGQILGARERKKNRRAVEEHRQELQLQGRHADADRRPRPRDRRRHRERPRRPDRPRRRRRVDGRGDARRRAVHAARARGGRRRAGAGERRADRGVRARRRARARGDRLRAGVHRRERLPPRRRRAFAGGVRLPGAAQGEPARAGHAVLEQHVRRSRARRNGAADDLRRGPPQPRRGRARRRRAGRHGATPSTARCWARPRRRCGRRSPAGRRRSRSTISATSTACCRPPRPRPRGRGSRSAPTGAAAFRSAIA